MKKYLLLLTLVIIIIPSITFASWWNPKSWFNYWKFNSKQQNVITKDIVNSALSITSTTDSSNNSTSTVNNSEDIKAEVKAQVEAIIKTKAEEEAKIAKQKAEEQLRINAAVKSALDKQAIETAQERAQTIQQTKIATAAEGEYYLETKYRLMELIEINKSFVTWLETMNSQFRTVTIALSGYSGGGLYGKARDSSIDLANAQIRVIDGLLTNTKKWLSKYQILLDLINSHPAEVTDRSALEIIPTLEVEERQIKEAKDSISSILESVMMIRPYEPI